MNDVPTEIWSDGTKIWKNSEGQVHREYDLPAAIFLDGYCAWYKNSKLHRDNDLPAVVGANCLCEWWIDGEFIKDKQCTKNLIEEYKKPYYLQRIKRKTKFNRFEKLIKCKFTP